MVVAVAALSAVPALESAALNIAIKKLISGFTGYSPSSKLDDDGVVREYIRTLNSNARRSLTTLRDWLRDEERMDEWKKLERVMVKVDEFDSSLRTSLTGEAERALKGTDPIPKQHLENLLAQDLRIMEQSKLVEEICQKLLEEGTSADSAELVDSVNSIAAQLNSTISMFNERRSLINGLPLSVVTGEKSSSMPIGTILGGLSLLLVVGLGIAWKTGVLG
ncbi:MAG: hypothetical protein QF707_05885 [Candidatus Poseidoniaceae archaeon]|jgi:hypothetical protein|nr:hypothetical protein [Candidatus Poseidoniaceae archaeon]